MITGRFFSFYGTIIVIFLIGAKTLYSK